MRTSTVVSNSRPEFDSAEVKAAAKPRRKGPRRATAPAGSPETGAKVAPGLLIVGRDGAVQVPEAHDDGQVSAAEAATSAVGADGGAKTQETSGVDELAAEEPAVEVLAVEEPAVEVPSAEIVLYDPPTKVLVKIAAPVVSKTGVDDVPDVAEQAPDSPNAGEAEVAETDVAGTGTKEAHTAWPMPLAAEPVDHETEPKTEPATEENREELVEEATEEPNVEPALDAPETPLESIPMSRRERRLAEQLAASAAPQKLLPESEPERPESPGNSVPTANSASPAVTSSSESESESPDGGVDDSKSKKSKPKNSKPQDPKPVKEQKPRNRVWLWIRGFLLFVVLAAIVLGIGAVAGKKSATQEPPSFTEIQRELAFNTTRGLQHEASELAAATADSATKKVLTNTAKNLGIQAQALAPSGPKLPTAEPSTTAKQSAAPTTKSLSDALASSATTLVKQATLVDPGMSRVFAAAGTGQLLAARELATATGQVQPANTLIDSAQKLAASKIPEQSADSCSSPSTAASSSTGSPTHVPSSIEALTAVATGEQKAVYAYQVVSARTAGATQTMALKYLQIHQERLSILNAVLSSACASPIAEVPGYALGTEFNSAPENALAQFEEQLAEGYGDLVALSPANASSTEQATGSPDASPAVGSTLPTQRDLGIAWLLDSTLIQQAWGGTTSALPGIAQTLQPTQSAAAQATQSAAQK